jgi:hypothetical protein
MVTSVFVILREAKNPAGEAKPASDANIQRDGRHAFG